MNQMDRTALYLTLGYVALHWQGDPPTPLYTIGALFGALIFSAISQRHEGKSNDG